MLDQTLKNRIVVKIVNTFISLKFWSLVIITFVSTFLLYSDKLSGSEWTTLIITMYSMILGIREFFKGKVSTNDVLKYDNNNCKNEEVEIKK